MALEEVDVKARMWREEILLPKKWTNFRDQFLRDYNRQHNSKKSGCGTDEVFPSTWKWYKRLKFLKSGEIVLNSNVEAIDLDAPTPKRQKLTDTLTEKNGCLRQKYGNFKLKTGGVYRSRRRCFWGNGCCNFKKYKPLLKIIGRKKRNDILFEIELSDYKKQQSHRMNEHFGGPINISNSSNMTSQNSYSIPNATYGKTSLPVSLYDGE